MSTTKPIPLTKLRNAKRVTIAKLKGMKSIIRVESARTLKWFLILPAVGNGDARCVLLHKCGNTQPLWSISQCEPKILAEYRDRIIA